MYGVPADFNEGELDAEYISKIIKRVGRAMNKLLNGGGYKILSKMIKIWRFEQNRKNGTEASSVRTKSKMVENHENILVSKFWPKMNFQIEF